MKYIIKNNYIKATIDSYGAQLIELIDYNNLNRMHSPNPNTWNEVSPILFPFISRLKDFTYKVNNKSYNMPLHGFLRHKELQVAYKNDSSIEFYLHEDKQTLTIYPYKFSIHVKYEIINKSLKVSFKIDNPNDFDLRYMIGGHPGFKVPLYENENYDNYYLKFSKKENVQAMQVVNGFLANEFKPFLNNQDIINLNHNLFINDAIVLKDLKSEYVDLMSHCNDHILRFHFSDFNILAIWSLNDKKANYVCLEPWNGIQKDFVIEHEKMGVLTLNKHESASYSYTIEIIK